jgi:RecA/RadA recombinase
MINSDISVQVNVFVRKGRNKNLPFYFKEKIMNKDMFDFLKKNCGAHGVFVLPEKNEKYKVEDFIDTGSLNLNRLITGDYRMGLPRGRITEIIGEPSMFKTTLALSISSYSSNNKQNVVYVDAENGLNLRMASNMGCNKDFWTGFQPESADHSFAVLEEMLSISKFKTDLIIYDSVGGALTDAQTNSDVSARDVGSHASLFGKCSQRLAKIIYKTKTACLMINQVNGFTDEYTVESKGGQKFKHQMFCRIIMTSPRSGKIEGRVLDLDDIEREVEKSLETGRLANLKTIKNKMFLPYQTTSIEMFYGKGFSHKNDVISFLKSEDLISVRAGKVKYDDTLGSIDERDFIKKWDSDEKFKELILSKKEIKTINDFIEEDDFEEIEEEDVEDKT